MTFDPRKIKELYLVTGGPTGFSQVPVPVIYLDRGKYKTVYLINDSLRDKTVISIIQINPNNIDNIRRRNSGNLREGSITPSGQSPEIYAKNLTPKGISEFNVFISDELSMLTHLKDVYQLPVVEVRNKKLEPHGYANFRPLFFRCMENENLLSAGYLTKYYDSRDGWIPFKMENNAKHPSSKKVTIIDFQGWSKQNTTEYVIGDPWGIKGVPQSKL
ncbi:MAG: hypothetical protein V7701_11130 [Sneathiella sp.]